MKFRNARIGTHIVPKRFTTSLCNTVLAPTETYRITVQDTNDRTVRIERVGNYGIGCGWVTEDALHDFKILSRPGE